jgi:hypothetical protein
VARGTAVGPEGPRPHGRGPPPGAAASRLPRPPPQRPAAGAPGLRHAVPRPPRRRPVPGHRGPAGIVRAPPSLIIFPSLGAVQCGAMLGRSGGTFGLMGYPVRVESLL